LPHHQVIAQVLSLIKAGVPTGLTGCDSGGASLTDYVTVPEAVANGLRDVGNYAFAAHMYITSVGAVVKANTRRVQKASHASW
jgi:hypothetical protein